MSTSAAYLLLILIWSTTPLTIQWSTQGTGFAFAILARMLIGLLVASLLIVLSRIGFPTHARARRAYLVGGLALFGSMAFTYWAARYVHSGLISVLFGLSPLMSGVLAAFWLEEESLTRAKLLGTVFGAAGLAVIFLHGDALGGEHALAGLAALLCAVFIYSAGLVGLKRIGDDSPPAATTVGTLLVSLPLFALFWWLTDGQWPVTLPTRTGGAILYLGIFGSALGFTLYYYVIKHLKATKVSLITLMTPVIALLLGSLFNGEHIGSSLWLGIGLILFGLALHQREALEAMWQQALRTRIAAAERNEP